MVTTTSLLDSLRQVSAVDCDTFDSQGKFTPTCHQARNNGQADGGAMHVSLPSGQEVRPFCRLHFEPGQSGPLTSMADQRGDDDD